MLDAAVIVYLLNHRRRRRRIRRHCHYLFPTLYYVLLAHCWVLGAEANDSEQYERHRRRCILIVLLSVKSYQFNPNATLKSSYS